MCHTGVIQFPLKKGWKRVHRLVVLPDYQGIGIGTKFIKGIAQIYFDKGYNFNLTTTTPSIVNALKKDKDWILIRYGRLDSNYGQFGGKYENVSSRKVDSLMVVKSNYKK